MTVFAGSKEDGINQNYSNMETLQLAPLTSTEILARSTNDPNGTFYQNTTINKIQIKLAGALVSIDTTS